MFTKVIKIIKMQTNTYDGKHKLLGMLEHSFKQVTVVLITLFIRERPF